MTINFENDPMLTSITLELSRLDAYTLLTALDQLPSDPEEISKLTFDQEDKDEYLNNIMSCTILMCREMLKHRINTAVKNSEMDEAGGKILRAIKLGEVSLEPEFDEMED